MAASADPRTTNIHTSGTSYILSMPKPANHLLNVEATFCNIPGAQNVLDVMLPAWRPGRYLILDFACGVQNFSAADERGAALAWRKTDKSTWRIETGGAAGAVTVRYNVYANEFEKKTRGLDIDHAFISGESVFMYTAAHRGLPVELTVRPYGDWHVTTGLDDAPGRPNTYAAPSYDHLIDSPLEVGTQQDYEFIAEDKRHILSMSGRGNWDADAIMRDITKLVSANKRFWGSLPYDKYVFLVHCLPGGGGGVEHLNSTIVGARAFGFRNPRIYGQFMNLISHEYFHTWNIKQLRPRGLHPYDLQRENYAPELWIAEGTTSYYAMMMLIKARIGSMTETFDPILTYVTDERSRPGNSVMPLGEASFDAWIKYWRSNENAFNAEADFYGKGSMVSLALDLEIRHRSQNAKSLDDVMRMMYERFPLSGAGYTIDDFQRTAEECVEGSMEEFFALAIRSAAPLPWEATLMHAGLELHASGARPGISLGIATRQTPEGRLKIMRVVTGSPAEDAGLDPGDEIVAFDRIRASTPAALDDAIGEMTEGAEAPIAFFRDDILRETTVIARPFGIPEFTLRKAAEPTALQRAIFESWLQMPWESAAAAGE